MRSILPGGGDPTVLATSSFPGLCPVRSGGCICYNTPQPIWSSRIPTKAHGCTNPPHLVSRLQSQHSPNWQAWGCLWPPAAALAHPALRHHPSGASLWDPPHLPLLPCPSAQGHHFFTFGSFLQHRIWKCFEGLLLRLAPS